MQYVEMQIPGVFALDLEPIEDERGFFSRTFCRAEFEAHGLNPRVVQCNLSFSPHRGTIRGLHRQAAPGEEAKLVRCTRGAIFDVAVDLRRDSPTHRRWVGVELTAENRKMLYVPEGCAHGFQTLARDTEVCYQVSAPYDPALERGARWDDPAFGIRWPLEEFAMISDKDRACPDYR